MGSGIEKSWLMGLDMVVLASRRAKGSTFPFLFEGETGVSLGRLRLEAVSSVFFDFCFEAKGTLSSLRLSSTISGAAVEVASGRKGGRPSVSFHFSV